MRRASVLISLLVGLFLTSCGQYSFLLIKMEPGPSADTTVRQQVKTCNVSMTGAVNTLFTLTNGEGQPTCGGGGATATLAGSFEYSTLAESGAVHVRIEGIDINGEVLVSGQTDVEIVGGKTVEGTVTMSAVTAQ